MEYEVRSTIIHICKISPKVLTNVVTPDLNHLLIIELPTVNTHLAVPYRRPDSQDREWRIDTFLDELKQYCLNMVLGDLNLDQLDNNYRCRLNYLLEANGFAFLNEISTRGITRPQSGTILDLCLTNMLSLVHNDSSDHAILFTSTNSTTASASITTAKTRFHLNDAVRRVEHVLSTNTFTCGNELNIALKNIVSECTSVINVRSNHRILKSHIDRDLILDIRERDRLASLVKFMPDNDVIKQLSQRSKMQFELKIYNLNQLMRQRDLNQQLVMLEKPGISVYHFQSLQEQIRGNN